MRWSTTTAFLLPALVARSVMAAPKNVTVDDFDRNQITYTPLSAWQSTSDGSTEDRFMKTTTFTRQQGASASFSFSGATAIYYGGFGEIDTIPGTFEVDFDGTTRTMSGNIDQAHNSQQILFSRKGLDSTKNYTITVRKSSVSGSHDLNVDFFTYTVPDPADNGDVNDNIQKAPVAAIAGGIVAGVVVLALIAVIIFLAVRRKRRAAAAGGKTGKGEPKVDLEGGHAQAPIIGVNPLSPNGPRYSDYMNPSLGGPGPGGETYRDPYGAHGRQGSFDQFERPNLGGAAAGGAAFASSSSSIPQPQYATASHSEQPNYNNLPNAHGSSAAAQASRKDRFGLGPTQSQGAFYNPTISGAANLNHHHAPMTGSSSIAHTLPAMTATSTSDSASRSGAPTEFSDSAPLSPSPPPYDPSASGAQQHQQQSSLFPPRKS